MIPSPVIELLLDEGIEAGIEDSPPLGLGRIIIPSSDNWDHWYFAAYIDTAWYDEIKVVGRMRDHTDTYNTYARIDTITLDEYVHAICVILARHRHRRRD